MLTVASKNDKSFILNANGERISDKDYEHLESFSDGLARFSKDGKYGFIDKNENVVIKPNLPSGSLLSNFRRGSFSEGLYVVEFGNGDKNDLFDSGKFGYMDKKGNIVINPKFDAAFDFKNGKAVVELDKKHFFINKKGERISPYFDEISYESDGMIKIGVGDMLHRKYGFIKN